MEEPRKSIFSGRKDRPGESVFFAEAETCTRIDLRFCDGTRISIPYAHIEEILFEPIEIANIEGELEQIIIDTVSDDRIEIMGKNLIAIYDLLHRDKILWLREGSEGEGEDGNNPYVVSLQYLRVGDSEGDAPASS